MERRGIYATLFVIVLGLVSIYLFSLVGAQLQGDTQEFEEQTYNLYRILGVIVLIGFGILIEYKRVVSIFQNGIKLNIATLTVTVILFALLLLPVSITVEQLGIPYPSSIKGTISFIINTISTRSVLSVLTGILLVRSFSTLNFDKNRHLK